MSFVFRSLIGISAYVLAGAVLPCFARPPTSIPPGFNQPFIAAFNNNYRGLVEENHVIAVADRRNTEKYVYALIEKATSYIDAAFFDISDLEAAQALIIAHKRGVKVRILTDSDNLQDKDDPTKPRLATERLRRAGIAIRDDQRGAFMHHKFIIADGAAVWIGSMNLTTTSMYDHNNNGLIIRSRRVAANFQNEFDRLFVDGMFGGPRVPVVYPAASIGHADVMVYFSPNGGTREAILEVISGAKKRIRFMAFVFTEENIAQALIARHKDGIDVEGIFDSCLIDSRSQYYALRSAGIRAWRDGNQALMHHKVMIIDDHIVITGSYNLTINAESSNNESLVIMYSHKLAATYLQEYDRLRKASKKNKNLPPYDHPACRR